MRQAILNTLGHQERKARLGQDSRYVYPLVLQSVLPYVSALYMDPNIQELLLPAFR